MVIIFACTYTVLFEGDYRVIFRPHSAYMYSFIYMKCLGTILYSSIKKNTIYYWLKRMFLPVWVFQRWVLSNVICRFAQLNFLRSAVYMVIFLVANFVCANYHWLAGQLVSNIANGAKEWARRKEKMYGMCPPLHLLKLVFNSGHNN